jgi:hypothetical protein
MNTLHCHFFNVCILIFINKVDQHATNVKKVATDLQYYMFRLNTIKCRVSIFENLKKSYTIGLLFIVTQTQMALL